MNPSEPRGASRGIRFQDARPPHELRCALERRLMALFAPEMRDERLEFHASTLRNGLPCTLKLVFEEAEPAANHYSLHLELFWTHMPPNCDDYHRNVSASWFDLWCDGLHPVQPSPTGSPFPELYRIRAGQAIDAEAHLPDVASTQREIVDSIKRGATFSTSHKEGGTVLGWANGQFYRRDFGDFPSREIVTGEDDFLSLLRRFYDPEISRGLPPSSKVSEETAWRLILRLLNPS